MNLLALDTSSARCSVAFDGRHLCTDDARAHAASVAPFIKDLLEQSNSRPSGVVVVAGPGSYTGLRIGVSSAKGLCMALDIPLYAVSSLAATAAAAPSATSHTIVIERARRGELYVGAPGRVEDTVIEDQDVPEWLTSVGEDDALLVSRNPERLELGRPVELVKPTALHALSVVRHSAETYLVRDPDTFEPFYLKAFVARAAEGTVFDRLPFGGT